MIALTIDGKNIEVQEGTTVLRAAQGAGIEIPTLCDQPQLVPYGGCRLCLVEVEGFRTLQPSCTLPASNKMVVKTKSDRIKEARKFILTLIFSERNHFCPFCQVSGGDCDLQNAAYAEGMTHWPLQPNWQPYEVDASHPFFVLDNNRCILCRRCVRACDELVGISTLGFEERGARTILVADFGTPLGSSTCVSCGTCLQVCPTGALIDRRSAYHGRVAQVETTETICTECSMGCGIKVMTRDNHIVRIEGNWDAEVNHGILCKLGRFMPLEEDRQRLNTPLVKKNGALKAATWEEAYDVVANKMKPHSGSDGIIAVASNRLSMESLSLFKDIFSSGLKSSMVTTIDEGQFTAESTTFAAKAVKTIEGNLEAMNSTDCVVVVGIDLAKHHEVLGFMVKRGLPSLSSLIVVDEADNTFQEFAASTIKPGKGKMVETLALLGASGNKNEEMKEANEILASAKHPVIIYGKGLYEVYGQNGMKALVDFAERLPGSTLISPKGYANSLAASLLNLDTPFKANGNQAVFLSLGDDTPSERLIQKIEKAPFLTIQASYHSKATANADVVFPVQTWAESEGHYLNFDGRIQSTTRSLQAHEGVRSSEEALLGLAKSLGVQASPDWKTKLSEKQAIVAIQKG
ncbi:MAG: molybdopterin-dependent oxidoreductase [Anaerolineaceae bacterium]